MLPVGAAQRRLADGAADQLDVLGHRLLADAAIAGIHDQLDVDVDVAHRLEPLGARPAPDRGRRSAAASRAGDRGAARRGCDLRSAPAAWSRSPAARPERRRGRRRRRRWARRCACAGSSPDRPAAASSRAVPSPRAPTPRQRRPMTATTRTAPHHNTGGADPCRSRAMALPRLHLFEFNDSPWAPRALRDTIVESLSRTLSWGRLLAGLVAPFEEFIARAGVDEVLDVCAGAAGPARILIEEIRRLGRTPPRFILTDLQPQLEAWQAARDAVPRADPLRRRARRRHGDPTTTSPAGGCASSSTPSTTSRRSWRRSILRDAVAGSAGIFIAEPWERNPLRFASFIPVGTLALAANPLLTTRDRAAQGAADLRQPGDRRRVAVGRAGLDDARLQPRRAGSDGGTARRPLRVDLGPPPLLARRSRLLLLRRSAPLAFSRSAD